MLQIEPLDLSTRSDRDKRSNNDKRSSILDLTSLGQLNFPLKFYENERILSNNLKLIDYKNVTYIYDPIIYAEEMHMLYLNKYCNSPKPVLFLGMNPGPFGMCQTGIPFGDVNSVEEWLKISGKVGKPLLEHPKRKIVGLDCKRTEVSGSRFWTFIKQLSGKPEIFFKNCFVHNFCPLSYLDKNGKNITPADMNKIEREKLIELCDEALDRIIELLKVEIIVAIGGFVYSIISKKKGIKVIKIMHPSPRNPRANKEWSKIVYHQLNEKCLIEFMKNEKINLVSR